MAQGLQGLNQGGGYDWETPYLNYLLNLPEDQQEYGQKLYDEYKFAKDYISQNNINLGQGPIEDYTNLFHNIYTRFGSGQPTVPPDSQNAQTVFDLSNVDIAPIDDSVPQYMGHKADEIKLDLEGFQELIPYIKDAEDRLKKYDESIEDFGKNYTSKALQAPNYEDYRDINNIKKIAEEVSPYYRMYGEGNKSGAGEYINLTDRDWLEISMQYQHVKDTQGEDAANAYLNMEFQNQASANQSTLEQYWRGLTGMGVSAAGAMLQFVGALQGMVDYWVTPEDYDVDGLNGFQRFVYAMENSSLADYGNKVTKYGTLDPAKQAFAEEYGGGLSYNQIMKTVAQEQGSFEDQLFNRSTLPTALSQGGFTVASMLIGTAEAKLAKGFFKGVAGASKRLVKDPKKLYKTFRNIGKLHNFTNSYVIPMVAGTAEGLVEGRQTQDQVYEDGMKYLNSMQEQYYEEAFNEVMDEVGMDLYNNIYSQYHEGESPINVNAENLPEGQWLQQILSAPALDETDAAIKGQVKQLLQDEINSRFKEKFDASKKQIEYASAKAGVNNFLLNSCINGVINQTLKAGIHTPAVQRSLANSKVFGRLQGRGGIKVTDNQAKSTYGFLNKAWDVAKEPLGEFTEEYAQSISDATVSGGASYNIHNYIDDIYNKDIMAEIGKTYEGQSAAAWKALKESLVSNEALISGIYGALSSGMGTVNIHADWRSPSINPETGKAEGTKFDAFTRRQTSEGRESFGHMMRRSIPWRTGISAGIERAREKSKFLEDQAQALTDWLQDADNMAKFKDTNASISWGKKMQDFSEAGDEFGFRNSVLGKTISDSFMLARLRRANPGMYDNLMAHYKDLSELDPNSEKAQKIVEEYNGQVTDDNYKVTAQELKDNAKRVLDTFEKVQKEDADLRATFGDDMDEDSRQALVYGKLALDDWDKRGRQMNQEISEVLAKTGLKDSVQGTEGAAKVIGDVYSKYGDNPEQLQKTANDLRLQAKEKDSKAKELQQKAHKDSRSPGIREQRRSEAKAAKAEAKTLRKEAQKIDEALKLKKAVDNNELVVSESQILNADPITRGEILNPKNFGKYSKKQQEVIQRVLDAGRQALGPQFVKKAVDSGRLTREAEKFTKQYSTLIENPESLKFYSTYAKRETQKYFAKRRIDKLAKVQYYGEFADQMDDIIQNGSIIEQSMADRILKGNANYENFRKQKQDAEELLQQINQDPDFDNLFDDDKALMTYMVNYLANDRQGIESLREDMDTAVQLLTDHTEYADKKNFQQYVKDLLPEGFDLSVLDMSDDHIASLYRELVTKANKNRAQVSAEKSATPVDTSNPNPAPAVNPTPGGKASVFSTMPQNPNEEAALPEDKSQEEYDQELKAIVERAKQLIQGYNAPDEAKKQLLDDIDNFSLQDKQPTDFLNELSANRTKYLSEGKNDAAGLADWLVASLKGRTDQKRKVAAGDIQTLPLNTNINWMQEIVRKYKIFEFLKTNPVNKSTPIYFYTDKILGDEVIKSMAIAHKPYNKVNDSPLLAVVEVSEDQKDVAIAIQSKGSNGETITKYYRPIGILPASNNEGLNGNKTANIRQQITEDKYGKLMTDTDGRLITSTGGFVQGENPKLTGRDNHNDFIELVMQGFLPREVLREYQDANGKIDGTKLSQFLGSEEFTNLVDRFFEDAISNNRFANKQLQGFYYQINTLFNATRGGTDNDAFNALVRIKPLSESVTSTGITFLDVLKSGNPTNIRDFNSRTKRYVSTLAKVLSTFNPKDPDTGLYKYTPSMDANGVLVNSAADKKDIDEFLNGNKGLASELKRFMTFSSHSNASYGIVLRQTEEERQSDNYHYELVVNTDGNEVALGTIWESGLENNTVTQEDAAMLLANLVLDNTKQNLRFNDAGRELMSWGVDWGDFDGTSSNEKMARENRLDIVADNILDMSVSSLIKEPSAVQFHAPNYAQVDADGQPLTKPTVRQNPDNAGTSNPSETGDGNVVKTPTGEKDVDGLPSEPQTPKQPQTPQLVSQLEDFAKSTTANTEVSPDGTTLTVSGTESYTVIPNLLEVPVGTLSEAEITQTLENLGLYPVSSPFAVKGELNVINNGEASNVRIADNTIHLAVRSTMNNNDVCLVFQTNDTGDRQLLTEYVSIVWQAAEAQLGRKISSGYIVTNYGAVLTVSSSFLTTSRSNILNAINSKLNNRSDSVDSATPAKPMKATKVETPSIEDISGNPMADVSEMMSMASEGTEQGGTVTSKPSGESMTDILLQPQFKWGVWQKADGTQRSKEDIQKLKTTFVDEGIESEQAYIEFIKKYDLDPAKELALMESLIDCM